MQWQLCQGWVSTVIQRKVLSRRGSGAVRRNGEHRRSELRSGLAK
jgi:hypothetical protein